MDAYDAHKALYNPNIFRVCNIHNSKVYFALNLFKFKTTDEALIKHRWNSYNIIHFNNKLLLMSQKNRFFCYFI